MLHLVLNSEMIQLRGGLLLELAVLYGPKVRKKALTGMNSDGIMYAGILSSRAARALETAARKDLETSTKRPLPSLSEDSSSSDPL
jgi:hypothetical protein